MNMYNTPSSTIILSPETLTLFDRLVDEKLMKDPFMMYDGPFPMYGKSIGRQRMDNGQLGAIVVNPATNLRNLFGLDFRTLKVRNFGLPRPPKMR